MVAFILAFLISSLCHDHLFYGFAFLALLGFQILLMYIIFGKDDLYA